LIYNNFSGFEERAWRRKPNRQSGIFSTGAVSQRFDTPQGLVFGKEQAMFTRSFSVGRTRVPGRAVSLVLALGLVIGALSLAGCEQATEPDFYDRQFIPVGHWSFGSDSYTIERSALTYTSSWAESVYEGVTYPGGNHTFSGDIVAAVDFSETSGALIIKITGAPTYDVLSSITLTSGKYTGVYYKDCTSPHIFLANPIDLSYKPIEVDTLNEALSTFTDGNMGTHVSYWGTGYSK
jgi:hypothetical protein